MKRDTFQASGVRIETWHEAGMRIYCCWKPNVSTFCRSRKEVLSFVSWPAKTPTGDALRAQLDAWEAADAAKATPQATEVDLGRTWGPEGHLDEADPNHNTKMVV